MENPKSEFLDAIGRARSFDELRQHIVEYLSTSCDAEVCTIWRRYEDEHKIGRLRLLAASAQRPQALAEKVTYKIPSTFDSEIDGVTAFIAFSREEVHVSSFLQLRRLYGEVHRGKMDEEQWGGRPEENFHSLSAFPLMLANNLVGVLKLENKVNSTNGFPRADIVRIRELTPEIALCVHMLSLSEQHDKRLIEVPARMVEAILTPFETHELVSEIVRTVADQVNAEICSLWLVDPNRTELRLADGHGFETEARDRQTYRLAHPDVRDEEIDGITAWVGIRRETFDASSRKELTRHPSWRGKWDKEIWDDRGHVFRGLYAIPLLRGENLIGVLKVENRRGEPIFTESDRAICKIMSSLIVLVLELGQQLRSGLISDLAHVLRSPIGQVAMNLSMVEREISRFETTNELRSNRVHTSIDFIKRALLSVTLTTRTIVAFAQNAQDLRRGTQLESLVLSELILERVEEISHLLYSGIRIKAEFTPLTRTAVVELDIPDRTRLQTAIDNILHNAIKYSKANSVVRIKLEHIDSELAMRISDTGYGIVEEDLKRIWEPGFTRRAVDHPQGTGMGLTTVRQIVERLGWAIDVSSIIGHGTTFTIILKEQGATAI